jgi:hypothetical protein
VEPDNSCLKANHRRFKIKAVLLYVTVGSIFLSMNYPYYHTGVIDQDWIWVGMLKSIATYLVLTVLMGVFMYRMYRWALGRDELKAMVRELYDSGFLRPSAVKSDGYEPTDDAP